MSEKVTDLEKFVLEHVYRPYWSMIGEGDNIKGLNPNFNLGMARRLLDENPEWRRVVLDRIYRIDFDFPTYIHHPLVDYIVEYCQNRFIREKAE